MKVGRLLEWIYSRWSIYKMGGCDDGVVDY